MDSHPFHGRREDRRLITGHGRYASDHNLPDQLHAAFVRSDRPHAKIVKIDASAALAIPGVHAIVTGEDARAAGFKSLPTGLAVKGRGGAELIKPHRPALAQDVVRFVGEPVAVVVAESRDLAQDAALAVLVDYEDLPFVTSALDALAPGAPQIHSVAPGNRVFDFIAGDEEKTAQAFASAKHIVRLTLNNNRVAASPIEPRGLLAHVDPATGHHRLWSTTQGVNTLRGQLCGVMGLADDKLDVIAQDVGGGFGVRSNIHPEHAAILLAARIAKRPVKWTSSRSEAFLADEQGRDVHSFAEMAVDANGRFLALRVDLVANLGAYLAPAGPFVNMRATTCLTGVYDLPIAFSRTQLAVTNTAPMAAYRGAGRPIGMALLERLVTRVARELGLDEAEVRRINMIPPEKFPYKLANGYVYDSGDPRAVMAKAIEAFGWNDRAAYDRKKADARARGKRYGRGLATAIEPTGAGNVADNVDVRFAADGRITVYAVSHSSGQGHETAFPELLAGALGIDAALVTLREGDPAVRLVGNGSGGSRSMHGVGSALHAASKEIIKKGLALAAEKLEAPEADLEFVKGAFRIKGTDRRIELVGLAKMFGGQATNPLDTRAEHASGSTWPNGCHIAEVEIDPATGVVEVLSYLACDDAGNIINHTLVEGQMHGGIAQGLGQVLGEHMLYDRASGQLLTGSYMDYPMPRAGLIDFERITLLDHPVPTPTNPIGVKGVGESGVTGSLPTVMNAITDALGQLGVKEFDMPATPARVWLAIQEAQAGRPAALAVAQQSAPS